LARAITSCGIGDVGRGDLVHHLGGGYPSIRSAPTLKIWMTPFASVAMLEKLALLKIASCSAPVVELPEGFDHVGLLIDQPLIAWVLFNESSEIEFSHTPEPMPD
jgi:hypothetical protein